MLEYFEGAKGSNSKPLVQIKLDLTYKQERNEKEDKDNKRNALSA
jgi:hypothetical protein